MYTSTGVLKLVQPYSYLTLLTKFAFLYDFMYILYQCETFNSSFFVQVLYGIGGFVWSFDLHRRELQE